jgi:predicted PurR-regulated permease PerM
VKQLALLAATAVGTVAGALVLWNARGVLALLAAALMVTAALRPLADRLAVRGWPRPAALLAVYGVALGLGCALVWLAAGPALDDLRRLADDFLVSYERAWLLWPSGTAFQKAAGAWLPRPPDLYAALADPGGLAALQGLLGLTLDVFDLLGKGVLVLMLSVFLGLDQARTERLWFSVLPIESRARVREVWRGIEQSVGAYVRSEAAQSVLAGALLGLVYWALGLKYPWLLAVLTGLAWLVPWLGTALALAPVVALTWSQGPWLTGLACVCTGLVFGAMELWVEPRLYGRRQHSALFVALLLIVLGKAYGLAGILAAPPLAAALQMLLERILAPASLAGEATLEARHANLAARTQYLRRALVEDTPAAEPPVVNLADRLQVLVDQAGEALQVR